MNVRLGLVVAVAVGANLSAALHLGNEVTPLPGTHDQVSYHALAQRVAAGHGFSLEHDHWPMTRAGEPTAHWSFLYSGALAAVYRVFGPAPLLARVLQAVLVGVLLPVGLFRLGRRYVHPGAGLWAAGLGAVYAYFVYYSAALMTEMATIVAVVWTLDLMGGLAERPALRRWALLGALLAAVGLLRQVAVPPLAVVAGWLLWRRHARRDLLGAVVAVTVAVGLVLPVTVRNYRAFGRVVPVNTNAGYAFFWANHPVYGTTFQGILDRDGTTYQELVPVELRHLDEAALGDALLARGLAFIAADPVRYARLSWSRLPVYFQFWPSSASSVTSNLARLLSLGLLLPFALHGLWLSVPAWRRCLPLYLFAAAYALVHLLSWALIRYRLPVDAVLLLFAGLSLQRLAARVTGGVERLGARAGPLPERPPA